MRLGNLLGPLATGLVGLTALSAVGLAQGAPAGPASVPGLGTILVDSSGLTLYTFSADQPGAGTSACDDSCAAGAPPALLGHQPAPSGGSLGTINRDDGSVQLTWSGMPLYRFVRDGAPGDA